MSTAVAIESAYIGEAQRQEDSLALDPSDPLNLLLHNSPDTDSELSQAATPPDWSQFSSLWPVPLQHTSSADPLSGLINTKPQASEFDFSFLMDMDFSSPSSMAVAVDPNMLYLDGKGMQLGVEPTSVVPIRPQDILADSSLSSADESSSRPSSSAGSPSSGFGGSPVVSHAPANTMGMWSCWSHNRG